MAHYHVTARQFYAGKMSEHWIDLAQKAQPEASREWIVASALHVHNRVINAGRTSALTHWNEAEKRWLTESESVAKLLQSARPATIEKFLPFVK